MKKINKKILTSIFIFFIILLLSISIIMANNVFSEKNIEIDEEKIYYEIKYLDSNITYMANLLNNDILEINWQELQNKTNSLYNYWNSAILDLNYLDIDKDKLTDFGKDLDELSISIKYHNKKNTLIKFAELYNKLTIYISSINYEDYTNILFTKYNLLLSTLVIETGNWTLAQEYVLKASEYMQKVVNSINVNQYTQYNINQAYVAIKEMENLINIKDAEIFYIKYNIAIEKLENI